MFVSTLIVKQWKPEEDAKSSWGDEASKKVFQSRWHLGLRKEKHLGRPYSLHGCLEGRVYLGARSWVALRHWLPTLQALQAEGTVLHRQASCTVRAIAQDDQRVPGHGWAVCPGYSATHTARQLLFCKVGVGVAICGWAWTEPVRVELEDPPNHSPASALCSRWGWGISLPACLHHLMCTIACWWWSKTTCFRDPNS